MGCERWNERDRDRRGPLETQRQGQMEMRETSGQTDREVDTALQGDRGRYRVKGGERNIDHISSTKDGWKLGETRETQKGRVTGSKERQRHQRDGPKLPASGGPRLRRGSGDLLPIPTQPHPQQAGFSQGPAALIRPWGMGAALTLLTASPPP